MSETDRFDRMIRWYPPTWRSRYGDEMTALLEDIHGMNDVPFRERVAIAKAGSIERAREAGLVGDSSGPRERVRGGTLLVLCAWSLFAVAAAIFAKFSEDWKAATPVTHRWLPSGGLHAALWGAEVGVVVVLVAAMVVLPSLIRLIWGGGWTLVRRPILRAIFAGAIASAVIVGISVWAHFLSYHDRNGGSWPYGVAVLIGGLAIAIAIAVVTTAAVSVARRIDLSQRILRLLGAMAIALTLVMAVIIVGTVLWWAALAAYAPTVLGSGIGNGVVWFSDTLPPTLVVAGVLMAVGLLVASLGTVRVAQALGSDLTSGDRVPQ